MSVTPVGHPLTIALGETSDGEFVPLKVSVDGTLQTSGGGGGGSIDGSIAEDQVAFGTGTDTISGSDQFRWDGDTLHIRDDANGYAQLNNNGLIYSSIANESGVANLLLYNATADEQFTATVFDNGDTHFSVPTTLYVSGVTNADELFHDSGVANSSYYRLGGTTGQTKFGSYTGSGSDYSGFFTSAVSATSAYMNLFGVSAEGYTNLYMDFEELFPGLIAFTFPDAGAFTIRRVAETPDAVLSVYDNGTSKSSLLDIVVDDETLAFQRYLVDDVVTFSTNSYYRATQLGSGAIDDYANPKMWFIPAASVAGFGGDAGFALYTETSASPQLAATMSLSPPVASVITNNTSGSTTVTYRLVGITPYGYHTAAGAESTTTTSNATPNNNIADPALAGVVSYDIYRTVGGSTQGKIASAVSSFPFNDDDLAGDGSDVALVENTTGHVYSSVQVDAPIVSAPWFKSYDVTNGSSQFIGLVSDPTIPDDPTGYSLPLIYDPNNVIDGRVLTTFFAGQFYQLDFSNASSVTKFDDSIILDSFSTFYFSNDVSISSNYYNVWLGAVGEWTQEPPTPGSANVIYYTTVVGVENIIRNKQDAAYIYPQIFGYNNIYEVNGTSNGGGYGDLIGQSNYFTATDHGGYPVMFGQDQIATTTAASGYISMFGTYNRNDGFSDVALFGVGLRATAANQMRLGAGPNDYGSKTVILQAGANDSLTFLRDKVATFSTSVAPGTFHFADLPTGANGQMAIVDDSNTLVIDDPIAGSGSNVVRAYYGQSAWRVDKVL